MVAKKKKLLRPPPFSGPFDSYVEFQTILSGENPEKIIPCQVENFNTSFGLGAHMAKRLHGPAKSKKTINRIKRKIQFQLLCNNKTIARFYENRFIEHKKSQKHFFECCGQTPTFSIKIMPSAYLKKHYSYKIRILLYFAPAHETSWLLNNYKIPQL